MQELGAMTMVVDFAVRLFSTCYTWHGRNVCPCAAFSSAPCSTRDTRSGGYRGSGFVTLIYLLNTMFPSSNARVYSVEGGCIVEIFDVVLERLECSSVVNDRSRGGRKNASDPGKTAAFFEDSILLLLFGILFPYLG